MNPAQSPVRPERFWDDVRTGPDGLVAVVVQDAGDGRVLMLAWADREALRRTAAERRAWFWSRSRRALWRKGDTSGHAMDVVEVRWDCDADAALYLVSPRGPACHTGAATCFYRGERGPVVFPDGAPAGAAPAGADAALRGGAARPAVPGGAQAALGNALAEVCATVAQRQAQMPEGSYVAGLLAAGPLRALQKMGEEAVEAVIAAASGGAATEVIGEFADLCFHIVVAMAAAGIDPGDVAAELRRRHAMRPPRSGSGAAGHPTPMA